MSLFGITSITSELTDTHTWVTTLLGANKVGVELSPSDTETAMTTSILKFSSLVNMFMIKNNLPSLIGQSTTADLTQKNIHMNINMLKRLSKAYEDETDSGGNDKLEIGYVTWSADERYVTLLDGNQRLKDKDGNSITADSITLFDVYHYRPPYSQYFYNPFDFIKSEFGVQGVAYSQSQQYFQIYPLWADMLNAAYLKTQAQFRRSLYSYLYGGKRLYLFPVPSEEIKIWMKFKIKQSVLDNEDMTTTGISNFTQATYNDLNYQQINALSKQWIREYTLAICKGMLGRMRRKFAVVPIPNGEVSLDGDLLLDESKQEIDKLEEYLKGELDQMLNKNVIADEAAKAENLSKALSYAPLPIIRGF